MPPFIWRVSEGGQTELFLSIRSSMPAFNYTLTTEQRWNVLAYLHQKFNSGFPDAQFEIVPHDFLEKHGYGKHVH